MTKYPDSFNMKGMLSADELAKLGQAVCPGFNRQKLWLMVRLDLLPQPLRLAELVGEEILVGLVGELAFGAKGKVQIFNGRICRSVALVL